MWGFFVMVLVKFTLVSGCNVRSGLAWKRVFRSERHELQVFGLADSGSRCSGLWRLKVAAKIWWRSALKWR